MVDFSFFLIRIRIPNSSLFHVSFKKDQNHSTSLCRYNYVCRSWYLLNELTQLIKVKYSRTSLYTRDRDRKICLAYNEFAYKKNKDDHKIEDRFYKKRIILNRVYPNSKIKRPHITRSACTLMFHIRFKSKDVTNAFFKHLISFNWHRCRRQSDKNKRRSTFLTFRQNWVEAARKYCSWFACESSCASAGE